MNTLFLPAFPNNFSRYKRTSCRSVLISDASGFESYNSTRRLYWPRTFKQEVSKNRS